MAAIETERVVTVIVIAVLLTYLVPSTPYTRIWELRRREPPSMSKLFVLWVPPSSIHLKHDRHIVLDSPRSI